MTLGIIESNTGRKSTAQRKQVVELKKIFPLFTTLIESDKNSIVIFSNEDGLFKNEDNNLISGLYSREYLKQLKIDSVDYSSALDGYNLENDTYFILKYAKNEGGSQKWNERDIWHTIKKWFKSKNVNSNLCSVVSGKYYEKHELVKRINKLNDIRISAIYIDIDD